MTRTLAPVLTLALLSLAGPAVAPAAEDGDWTCEGRIAMPRRSEIVEGGSIEGFLEATRDHMAWYRSHGIDTNIQVVARVVERDADTGEEVPSDLEIVTLHLNPPDREELPVGDAAWEAFVAKYVANSKIVDATRICLPDVRIGPCADPHAGPIVERDQGSGARSAG